MGNTQTSYQKLREENELLKAALESVIEQRDLLLGEVAKARGVKEPSAIESLLQKAAAPTSVNDPRLGLFGRTGLSGVQPWNPVGSQESQETIAKGRAGKEDPYADIRDKLNDLAKRRDPKTQDAINQEKGSR